MNKLNQFILTFSIIGVSLFLPFSIASALITGLCCNVPDDLLDFVADLEIIISLATGFIASWFITKAIAKKHNFLPDGLK